MTQLPKFIFKAKLFSRFLSLDHPLVAKVATRNHSPYASQVQLHFFPDVEATPRQNQIGTMTFATIVWTVKVMYSHISYEYLTVH